ncbi:3-oxoacyl-[acyl-carrier-protein] synthase 2 [Planctomycetales bacterium]|nr:3-oxoacyl-[acyl-carrier-protein] synthase 2 [Planctomycetales bacterium]GHT03282.1 3-oxoacyl-[acyl-carrier-protein] synthase 2 [Planctomycetales bacterium]
MANKTITLRRVVVTGIGLVSPVGIGTEETWKNIVAGVSGAATFDPTQHVGFPVQFGCEVKNFDVSRWLDPRSARRLDRFVHFCVASASLAKDDAGLDLPKLNLDRCGSVFASGIGGILSVEEQLMKFTEHGPRRISPFSVPMLMINGGCGQIAIEFGFRGLNYATVTACASSSHAIGLAFRHIQVGDADLIVAGGSEAGIGIMGLGGFANMHALSTRNDEPERASRPFDKNRDGFVIGEGAGALILEDLDHAKKRGAKIYAEVLGYGFTDDATHITAPDEKGDGLAAAMRLAMAMGEVNPEQIDYVNAHGTSTELNDRMETNALKQALGDHAYKTVISSTKSCTGHMLGAAGAFELGCSALAIRDGVAPPTINYETPDPECDLNYTPNKAVEKKIRYAMSNSCGFGGHNASLLIGEFRD